MHVRRSGQRVAEVVSRTGVRLPERSEVSFAAYFNAFPAAYWRRWSILDEITLRLRLRGRGRVDVYRSTARGVAVHVAGEVVGTGGSEGDDTEHEVVVPVSLAPFGDGGWVWFDLTSEGSSLELVAGGWYAEREAPGRAAIAVGMPTFNRPTDCVATLQALGDDPLVRDSLTAVIIPDQGTSKVRDQPGFDEAAAALGDKLRIIDQPNLGGSGGYARIMYEALENTDAEQILFMDDDIVLEPDSVLRALAFSRFAREHMLVGGQMLSLQARSHLHAMGEVVDRGTFFWQLAPHTTDDHDFAVDSLRETLWMHRRIDVDYNAWWMCLIPRSVAERIGLPLPLFIKWDDCEYGLRAGSHGIPTATVPGVAIWHMLVRREGRQLRLAGVLPRPQPPRRRRAARPGQPARDARGLAQAHAAPPVPARVLDDRAAPHGDARLPVRAEVPVRRAADRPRRRAGHPRGVPGRHGAPRRGRGAPLGHGRARVAAVAEAAGGQGRAGRRPRPRARATSCAPSTATPSSARSARSPPSTASGSCSPASTGPR